MAQICHKRYTYRYGEYGAETSLRRMDLPPSWARRIVDAWLMVLCFGTHKRYRERFIRARTNGGLHIITFQKVLAGMLEEWTGVTLVIHDITFSVNNYISA